MDDGGRPGVVRDGREMPGQARVMPHDVLMIRPEAHDFNLGWYRRSELQSPAVLALIFLGVVSPIAPEKMDYEPVFRPVQPKRRTN